MHVEPTPEPRSSAPPDSQTGREALVDLLQQIAGGDRAALGTLYRATVAKLYGVCLRILKDEAETEDVVQEVYMVVWRRAGAFDPQRGSPITWLAAIARNRAIDRLRARRPGLDGGSEAAEMLLASTPDAAPLPPETLERSQTYQRLQTCLEGLEPKHAQAIRTAFFEGVTYEALAEREAVPLGTMKSWVRRSLIRLRGCLDA